MAATMQTGRIEILHPKATDYLNTLARGSDPAIDRVLARLEEEATAAEFPIIGPAAGRFCWFMARMIGAKNIFELGSGFGYSTIWFARAIRETGGKGKVHHTVWDKKLSERARANVKEAGLEDLAEFHCAEAIDTLKKTAGPFDLIFNDIDKEGYPAALPVVKSKLRAGGIFITDNLLWHGRVFDPENREATTEAIRKFTKMISEDPDFISTLAPIRDGLWVAQKTK
jgi:predicted O-methyltransferase YrrM